MILGWKDRKTNRLYDLVKRCRDIDTKEILVIMKSQDSGQDYVVKNMFEEIEVDGKMVSRFCRWYIATEHIDNGF